MDWLFSAWQLKQPTFWNSSRKREFYFTECSISHSTHAGWRFGGFTQTRRGGGVTWYLDPDECLFPNSPLDSRLTIYKWNKRKCASATSVTICLKKLNGTFTESKICVTSFLADLKNFYGQTDRLTDRLTFVLIEDPCRSLKIDWVGLLGGLQVIWYIKGLC